VAVDQSTGATGTADVTNAADVVQAIQQLQNGTDPGDEPAGTTGADLAAGSTQGSATANQTGARNTNVSIRVGSPGSDAGVSQSNTATATGTSPGLGIVNITDGKNTNVSVVLPGAANGAPGDQWQWNWNWTGTGTPANGSDAATVAPTTGSVWTWNWAAASSSQAPVSSTSTQGFWTWTWTWVMPDGQTWTLTQQQACSCNWQWNWTWDWSTGLPASATSTATPPAGDPPPPPAADDTSTDDGAVTQLNAADSSATADVYTSVTQFVGQSQDGVDPALGNQQIAVDQRYTSIQSATATARADQTNARNRNSVWGVPIESVTQTNTVSADAQAEVGAWIVQQLAQAQHGDDTTTQWLGAQQWTGNGQDAEVSAEADQTDALNSNSAVATGQNAALIGAVDQGNETTATATAFVMADLEQWFAQLENAGVAGDQQAGGQQLLLNAQFAFVDAAGTQNGTQNVSSAVVQPGNSETSPRVRQRNIVAATATGTDLSSSLSAAIQILGGGASQEIADVTQSSLVYQEADASSSADQPGTRNTARWLGVSPPPPPAPGDGGDSGQDVPSPPPATASTVNAVNIPVIYTTAPKAKPGAKKHTKPAGRHGVAGSKFIAPASGRIDLPALAAAIAGGAQGAVDAQGAVNAQGAVSAQASSSTFSGPMTNPLSSGPAPLALAAGQTSSAELVAAGAASGLPAAPWVPGLPGDPGSAGSGTSGSAPPSGGGGLTVLAFGPYKFAAPAQLGPQVPAPVLGRSVTFLDPFERPG
jgi:hypothetical protein